jgi:hypothetical protein
LLQKLSWHKEQQSQECFQKKKKVARELLETDNNIQTGLNIEQPAEFFSFLNLDTPSGRHVLGLLLPNYPLLKSIPAH